MRAVSLLVVAACWTGAPPAEAPRAAPPRARLAPYPLDVRMVRTRCRDQPCESYEVRIAGDGTVRWQNGAGVIVTHVPRRRIEELDRTIDRVRFFELDAGGRLPSHLAACGPGQLCSFSLCGFPAHAEVSVHRGADSHEIDDELCGSTTAAAPLEELIDLLANSAEWVAR